MSLLGRSLVLLAGLAAAWQVIVWLTGVPKFILPPPLAVVETWWLRAGIILDHAWITALEIVLGLGLGSLMGAAAALVIGHFRPARFWLLPVLVASQAVPVFAIAPLLVLWLGYGLASKVGMAVLIIFFPVTAALFDGLRRTEPGWLDLAHTMTAGRADARRAILWHIRLPAALPALASGLRVATSVAPIGAIVGEWVGSSAGLGFLMLHATGRAQTDLTFAALLTLAVIALALYFLVDRLLIRLLPWQPDRPPEFDQR